MLLVCSFNGVEVEATEEEAKKLLASGSFTEKAESETTTKAAPKTRTTRKAAK